MKRVCVALVFMTMFAVAASAQTPVVINPTTIEWMPSPDHNNVLSDGQAILSRYDVQIFVRGATQPIQVYNAGKPTPNAQNVISINNPAWLVLGAMNVEGFAKVAAVGPAGTAVSDPSNPFAVVGPPAAPPAPVVRR